MDLFPEQPLRRYAEFCSGRLILGEPDSTRTDPVLIEWELRGGEFADQHPYDEFNFLLEGELHVECGGQWVVARVGDTVRVPAGVTGTYRARDYARMFAVYGPNPRGLATVVHSQKAFSDND